MNSYDENTPPHHNLAHKKRVVQPLPGQSGHQDDATASSKAEPSPAVDLIRQKIDALYGKEPNAKEEAAEAEAVRGHRSKHQAFMHELSASGKSLAEIQTAWHDYYQQLPDQEKHQVWQEFYTEHAKLDEQAAAKPKQPTVHPPQQTAPPKKEEAKPKPKAPTRRQDLRSVFDIKHQLVGKVQNRANAKAHPHLRSLLFGLSMGAIAVVLLLFSFFNERIIAPFVTPSRSVSTTPIIIDPTSTAVGPDPKVIIPKINVEIPVVYTEPSIQEAAIQRALEEGVVHYATTPNPGETGNGVIFGHSSNNILNKGKYKFAFVLLQRLENGDTFMLQKDGKAYVYRVFDKKVVKPTDLSVLGPTSKPSTMTLITCDPPGTSINRLVVVGEQISPDPTGNIAGTASQAAVTTAPPELPSNSPTLWRRLTAWLTG